MKQAPISPTETKRPRTAQSYRGALATALHRQVLHLLGPVYEDLDVISGTGAQ